MVGVPMQTARQVVVAEIDAEIERMEMLEADQLAEKMRLAEWGHWSRCFDPGLGYGKMITAQWRSRGQDEPSLRRVIPRIPDDEAMRSDAAVGALASPYRRMVERIYLYLESARSLSRQEQRVHCMAIGRLAEKLGC
jgi:hypothetical protein